MEILLSTDNNYVMPTGVLMHSIGDHCGKDVHYHVLTNEAFSFENREALTQISQKYCNDISFYTVTEETTRDLPFGRADQPIHVSIATYYRLFITKILPHDVHKILYLDGDMIVRHNLEKLWKTDISDVAVGVVHDMHEQKHCEAKRLPYPMETGYFNAGMMLINLDYWREHRVIDTFMDCIEKHHQEIILHDQDVLNCVFYNQKLWLPLTYNFQNGFLYNYLPKGFYGELEGEIERTMKDPAIVHFSTQDKPWKLEVFHTYNKDWRKYFFCSEWRHQRLEGENPRNLKDRIRNYLVRHCWYIPGTLYQKV